MKLLIQLNFGLLGNFYIDTVQLLEFANHYKKLGYECNLVFASTTGGRNGYGISDIQFDEIRLGHLVHELANYTHNFNGTGPYVVEPFSNSMGCNGTVSLKFTTPVYLWLLEHM